MGKVNVLDLISEETSFKNPSDIYSFPTDSLFFSKLINYKSENINQSQTFYKTNSNKLDKLKVGLVGSGNFAMSTFIPAINSSKEGYLSCLLGREGLSIYVASERFNIDIITTNESDFYKNIDVACIATPHQTHFEFLKKTIKLSLPTWIEKPLVTSEKDLIEIKKIMLSNNLVYAIGYNRSLAPWTKFMIDKINANQTNIDMTINAGELPLNHWLLNENACGGRIIGEFCHFVDLAIKLLGHTKLISVKCHKRDRYFQDTGNYSLTFEDNSKVNINYRHDMPASVPKEKIKVRVSNSTYTNNNWRRFYKGIIPCFVKNGKGHKESLNSFFYRVKHKKFSTITEINNMCFSTFTSLKLQQMSEGDILNISDCYNDEILSQI